MAHIIAADAIKETIPGYDPAHSGLVHSQSAKLADKAFELALKERSEEKVVILAGGAASGKTEYIQTYLKPGKLIVFDGTLQSFEGAKIKIRKVIKANKQPEIHLVIPGSLQDTCAVFLNRNRKFDLSHFYRTQIGARASVLQVAREYPEVVVRVIVTKIHNLGSGFSLQFLEKIFPSHSDLIVHLADSQYNEVDIKQEVLPLIKS